jgi:L-fucose mutarotase
MLKGLPALLTADLLYALRAMGHGDELALVDANFPAASLANRLIELPAATSPQTLTAILRVLPVDAASAPAAYTMEAADDPQAVPAAVAEFAAVFTEHGLADCEIGHLDRNAFRERARRAFAVVRTGDLRPYASILVVKGAIEATALPPDAKLP